MLTDDGPILFRLANDDDGSDDDGVNNHPLVNASVVFRKTKTIIIMIVIIIDFQSNVGTGGSNCRSCRCCASCRRRL